MVLNPAAQQAFSFISGATPATTPPAPAPAPTPAHQSPSPSPQPTSSSKPQPSSNSSSPSAAPSQTVPAPAAPATDNKDAKVPTSKIDDTRVGLSLELITKVDRHTPALQLAYSTESDYESFGLALKDAIDFNKKNTTLLLGVAGSHDIVKASSLASHENKDTIDVMVGLTQVISPTTLFTANLTLGHVEGYLADPYKVVELNGVLVPEKRPDSKDKTIAYLSLTQFFNQLNGSLEASFRWYNDTYGITSETCTLAWYQNLGRFFILAPSFRLYDQTAADFYAYRFSGSPDYYSSDYRVSALRAYGYGLKLIWKPNDRFAVDVAVERYEQEGKDSETPDDAYPAAMVFTGGARIWF
ncbi:MAG: DUF3570 domain-containing protein [Lentisphaerota bacterium]